MKLKDIRWKRLAWVVFIVFYTSLFFYNCLSPYRNWFFSYAYTMLLVLWLAVEYYQKHLFFQSGLLPGGKDSTVLRSLFALFFYASFIIGITTVVAWDKYQIKGYPVFQCLGIALLVFSVFLRIRAKKTKAVSAHSFSDFYFSIVVLMVSLALGYGSYFILVAVVIVGLPLIILQGRREEMVFSRFSEFIGGKNITAIDPHSEQWERFVQHDPARRKK